MLEDIAYGVVLLTVPHHVTSVAADYHGNQDVGHKRKLRKGTDTIG